MKPAKKISQLFEQITKFIEESRKSVAVSVNWEITNLYWNIGTVIRKELFNDKRAEYGKKVVENLSVQLISAYGRGWSQRHLPNCIKFSDVFYDIETLHTLCAELSWSHLRLFMGIDDEMKRSFYMEICKLERWPVRLLQERINSMLYERTAISKKPEETVKKDIEQLRNNQQITPDMVFRDPYVLDFLGLQDSYSEKDLESAIVAELQKFIIELGNDFAFLARQKRITIDNRDYKIDLLFFHRRLRSLVAIDLKIGEVEAGHKGQMELYLRWLEKYETVGGENPPLGLILCAGKNSEHIELLELKQGNIKVAEYMTALPPKKQLMEKFHRAVESAKKQFEIRQADNKTKINS